MPRFKIKVGVPPEKAFNLVADIARHGEWANPKAGLKVEPVSGGPVDVGSTFRSTQKFVGKDTGADIKVTKYAPPKTLAFEALHAGKKGTQKYTSTFTFTPVGDGTLIERTIELEPPSVTLTLAYPAVRADAMKALKNLKTKLESGA